MINWLKCSNNFNSKSTANLNQMNVKKKKYKYTYNIIFNNIVFYDQIHKKFNKELMKFKNIKMLIKLVLWNRLSQKMKRFKNNNNFNKNKNKFPLFPILIHISLI